MTHQDSELTITNNSNTMKTAADDVECVSAAADPDEPVVVDGPLYGWVIVFAAFTSQMVSMGVCNVYGVYQVWFLSLLHNVPFLSKCLFF